VPRTYIALDLETTGLDASRDAIIEVGAVKFLDGEPVDSFSTLVNPGRPIPYEITLITGITDRDVIGMPAFDQVAGPLMRFVGLLPVVGHSVGFDLGFVRAQGLLAQNVGLDSWELASILLPGLPSYSLGALAARFSLPLASQHRALDDAQASGLLFRRLCDEAAGLPRAVLLEINRLGRDSGWPLAEVFADALAATSVARPARPPSHELSLEQLAPGSPLFQPLRVGDPLEPHDTSNPIDVAELAAVLEPGGVLSQAFPGYEYRLPQVAMLEAVAGAFNQRHHLMAEAGTGTGKSLAYLLPAIAYAVKNSTRVVVSTNTINLQDQLFKKDLPDLQRILSQAWGKETPFRAALLKGRSNYLCPRRFAALKSRPSFSDDELRGIVRILVWLPRTQTGDQSELSLPKPADRLVWSQVAADSAGCSLDRCQREMNGQCFFYRARRQAESAHILVVNHALLMADAATENRVLPEYRQLILDEAHHLEGAVTDQLSFRADTFLLGQLFTLLFPQGGAERRSPSGEGARRAGRERGSQAGDGLLAELADSLRSSRLPGDQLRPAFDQILRLQSDVEAAHTRLSSFWEVMQEVLENLKPQGNNSDYDLRLRITDAVRSQPYWVEVEVAWENLAIIWSGLLRRLDTLSTGLSELLEAGLDAKGLEGLAEEIGITGRNLSELYAQMEGWCLKPAANQVYWAETGSEERRNRRIVLRAAPLHIGPLVQEHIFFPNDTAVLTSATLRTAGSFDYLRDRLCAQEADTTTVGSPFDYKESTLLYLPSDLPEPTASGYQTAVEQALIGLARALGGRTLVLFTAYAQLRRTVQAIVPALTEAGVMVLSQGSGGSRHQLLETFKNSDRTILMGTRSFWEGVDVVGPALSALVLVRLPFAVPNDPIVAARSETFDDPFYQYSVPDAILRFRQGFGRLIRSKTDRGVVVILDKRIQSKSYGRLFLDSLPECTIHKGPLMNLPSEARRWIERPVEI
jgi:DNA polymerase-3 subunit epsilon/ATP-dependent DNA helicase DinG